MRDLSLRWMAMLTAVGILIGILVASLEARRPQAEAPVVRDPCHWIYEKARTLAIAADRQLGGPDRQGWSSAEGAVRASIMWSTLYTACREDLKAAR